MRILYVIYGEVLAPVVRSQTFPLLRLLGQRGHRVSLLVYTSPRRLLAPGSYREALQAAAAAVSGRVTVRTHTPRHLALSRLSAGTARLARRERSEVIHCRQSRATVVAARARAAPVLADMRGIRPEEYMLSLGKDEAALTPAERRVLQKLRRHDEEALATAAAVVCVSEPYRRHLGGGKKVHVIPNPAEEIVPLDEEERRAVRAELGFTDSDFVCVYSGSLAPWQCAREAVELFRAIRAVRPAARLLILSHDSAGARGLLAAGGVPEGVAETYTPEETRRRLPAFDLAFLLRERHAVNEVSCPVKFAEYLHAGLPVVLTEGIGDASGWVAEHGLGLLLADPRSVPHEDELDRLLSALDGRRCRRFARRNLAFPRAADAYEAAYRAAMEAS